VLQVGDFHLELKPMKGTDVGFWPW
jgi:hypothetical protein